MPPRLPHRSISTPEQTATTGSPLPSPRPWIIPRSHLKETAGIVTGDKDLKAQGKADQRTGKTEEKIDHAKDKVEEVVDKTKDALHR